MHSLFEIWLLEQEHDAVISSGRPELQYEFKTYFEI